MDIDVNLRDYATATQWSYYEAYCRHDSLTDAGAEFGVHPATISSAVSRIKKAAASRHYSPEHDMKKPGAEGFHLKGYSELVDKEGNTKIRWNKFYADKEEMYDRLFDAAKAIAEPFAATSLAAPEPDIVQSALMNVIPFGDPHIGLYTHRMETYNDFDCDKVEEIMIASVDHLINTAPNADTALIINLGDFYHADTPAGVTSRAGHKLDVDGKWSQILEVGIRIMRRSIDIALTTHSKVVVMNTQGNHDDMTSQVLSIVMREYYRNNVRVTIKDSTKAFQYHQFGKNLFGVTHGHTIKPQDLDPIMASDCADVWSSTKHRKWLVGHFHSQKVHDLRNCTVEYYRTLAPGDAWAVSAGYRSHRDMRCETWHKEFGHVGTAIFDPMMLGNPQ